jgi:hypothetical protein
MIRMVYSPIGIIIGEKVNAEPGLLALKDPRIMQMVKTEDNGRTQINIVPMMGNPNGFEIERGIMNYDVTDQGILNAYKSSVTGLALVNNPLVDGSGKPLQ